ncbi:biopolymer transporter ExbD, partial [Rubripirellula sp.]|nr:biopolymer transporter ExbD [Rubripirellula sp.]
MKASRKKKRRKVQVPIASMGDIAFLLIIFFMLLSEFSKDKDLPIELPRSDQVKKTEIVVVARVAVAADGVIYFDGDQVDSAKDIE